MDDTGARSVPIRTIVATLAAVARWEAVKAATSTLSPSQQMLRSLITESGRGMGSPTPGRATLSQREEE